MTPWFVMPCGVHATRAIALNDARELLGAVRCAATLIAVGDGSERDRRLALAMLGDLGRADRALDQLERSNAGSGECGSLR